MTLMSSFLIQIEKELSQQKSYLKTHPLYESLTSEKAIQVFMENHVFAVWDFMSLVKTLQHRLTSVEIPWTPKKPKNCRLINEIVLGEESDLDPQGLPCSHYSLYLDAMKDVGAKTEKIVSLVSLVKQGYSVKQATASINLPFPVCQFLNFTFNNISMASTPELVAIFLYGREDIIPELFLGILQDFPQADQYQKLIYYLERHIEIDGEQHSKLGQEMMLEICGNSPQHWNNALSAATKALQVRRKLWDFIHKEIIYM